jgi:N-acylneuraminate cytidylyltransferase
VRVVAVVPARGGSRRIPGKNLIVVAGRPLLVHTIEQALAARSLDEVVVSTDDEAIAAVATRAGASVVERPVELADDAATSESALLHALDVRRADPEVAVLLQATCPVRTPHDIDATVALVRDGGADSAFSAVAGHVWLWEEGPDGLRSLSYDWRARPRTQDLPRRLQENGSIYATRTALLRTTGNRLGGRIAAHAMHPDSAIDLDEPDELEALERAMARLADR